MLLHLSPRRVWVVAALVTAAACRSQPAAVNLHEPEIVATVEAILDKAVAAAGAIDAEGVLSASTRDDTFTFITGDRMLKGYDETLAAFRQTYALLQGPNQPDHREARPGALAGRRVGVGGVGGHLYRQGRFHVPARGPRIDSSIRPARRRVASHSLPSIRCQVVGSAEGGTFVW